MKNIAMAALSLALSTSAFAQAGASAQAAQADDARQMVLTRAGTQASTKGPAANFAGSVRVYPLFGAHAPSTASGAAVTLAGGSLAAALAPANAPTGVVAAALGSKSSSAIGSSRSSAVSSDIVGFGTAGFDCRLLATYKPIVPAKGISEWNVGGKGKHGRCG